MPFGTALVGEAPVAERLRLPALVVEEPRLERSHIAGEDFSVRPRNDIEICTRLTRPTLQRAKQPVDPGAVVDIRNLGYLGGDRVARLLLQETLRHAGHVEDEEGGAKGEQDQIERREPDAVVLNSTLILLMRPWSGRP